MVTRQFTIEEAKKRKWKAYSFKITQSTKKCSIIQFIESKKIKTNEVAYNKHPIFLNPLGVEIILIFKDDERCLSRYNYYFQNNKLYFDINGNWLPWGKIKHKIKTIFFLDNLMLHPKAKKLWNNKGFLFTKFYKNKVHDNIVTEILNEVQNKD